MEMACKNFMLEGLRKELRKRADSQQAEILQRFFKTGPGGYGEGDVFLGIKVPVQRSIVKEYMALDFESLQALLNSDIHEERFCALAILCKKYVQGDEKERKKIFGFYMKNSCRINSWDLVDLSAPNIVGDYLLYRDRKVLYKMAHSKNLWRRRIAMLSTFTFIKRGDFKDALRIAELFLEDEHDLMHKASGWMLREIGKIDPGAEEKFLNKHYKNMPRTMLRYAIEKFDSAKKDFYMGR